MTKTSENRVPQRHRVPAHLARRFHQVCLGITADVTERADLTPVEFAVIAALAEVPDTDQGSLATRLGIDAVRRITSSIVSPLRAMSSGGSIRWTDAPARCD
jgi:hypothetical protein